MNRLTKMSVKALSDALTAKEVSAVEAAKAYLDRIEERDAAIGAYLTVTAEQALLDAAEIDRRRLAGEKLHPLAGVPFGVKDNICTKGVKTTAGSKMLSRFVPVQDAPVVSRLRTAGAVLLGKQNMDEFGMGSSTEHSAFRPTRNPIDPTRVPGGSSGGGAAAVADGMAAFALGSDTGGSVRQPAAMCGIIGLRPTYGSISRNGLVAFASSMDQIGVLSRDAHGAAMVFAAIAGKDPYDATSLFHVKLDYQNQCSQEIAGKRIALPKEYFSDAVSLSVRQAVLDAVRVYEKLGCTVEEVSLPMTEAALPAYYILAASEASSNLARYDGIRYGYRSDDYIDLEDLYRRSRSDGFGEEVKRRILLGTFALSSGYVEQYYKKAMQVRSMVSRDFAGIFAQYDLILTPTAPHTAWRFGERTDRVTTMYEEDICTVPASLAGLPAISVCCGKDENGLPIGMQLIGKRFAEGLLFAAAEAFEKEGGV